MNHPEQITACIRRGEDEKALELIRAYSLETPYEKDQVLLHSRFSDVKRKSIGNLVSIDELQREKRQIRNSILELLELIQRFKHQQDQSFSQKQNTILLELNLEVDFRQFVDNHLEELKALISENLRIDASNIKYRKPRTGSIILPIELPIDKGYELIELINDGIFRDRMEIRYERIFEKYGNNLKIIKEGGIILRGENLKDANLRGAVLRWADLEEANLQSANLRWANLEGVNFKGANLKSAGLQSSNLLGANLEGAELNNASLEWGLVERANFRKANLNRIWLKNARLSKANFSNATLLEARLQWVRAEEVNFQEANLKKIYARGAFLFRASFLRAKLNSARLQIVNLQEADLRAADLQGANLQGANLKGAKLQEADIRGVDLQRVNLVDAQLHFAKVSESQRELLVKKGVNVSKIIFFPDPREDEISRG